MLNAVTLSFYHLGLIYRAAKVFSIGEYIELDFPSQHTVYLFANQSIAGMNYLNRMKLALNIIPIYIATKDQAFIKLSVHKVRF